MSKKAVRNFRKAVLKVVSVLARHVPIKLKARPFFLDLEGFVAILVIQNFAVLKGFETVWAGFLTIWKNLNISVALEWFGNNIFFGFGRVW